MTRRLATWMALAAVALAAFGPALAAAAAAPPAPRAEFSDVEDELMCVVCGVPLPLAEAPQAERERAQIRRDIAAGLDKQQIKDHLVTIYSDAVLAKPKGSGFGVVVYVVPIAIVLAALALVAVLLPKWRAGRGSGPDDDGAPPDALDREDADRLDADLARYRV